VDPARIADDCGHVNQVRRHVHRPRKRPREGGPTLGDERATLVEFPRCQRATLELKCSGLDAADLARRSVDPSTLSLLGLVRRPR